MRRPDTLRRMDESVETLWRRLRHDLRGAYHQLRLCADALAIETEPLERLRWLSHIEQSADRCAQVAADIEVAPAPPASEQPLPRQV